MFTGLVEEVGTVVAVDEMVGGMKIQLLAPKIRQDATIGDSIAINGCCLTVVENGPEALAFEAGSETLSRTNLGQLAVGHRDLEFSR